MLYLLNINGILDAKDSTKKKQLDYFSTGSGKTSTIIPVLVFLQYIIHKKYPDSTEVKRNVIITMPSKLKF